MKSRFCRGILAIALTAIVVLIGFTLVGHRKSKPIKIGLATTLTGRSSTGAVQSRNGAILAVEEINAKGGINGRLIEIIFKDDQADPEVAVRVDNELVDEGVVAILGHTLSVVGVPASKVANDRNVLMVSFGCLSTQLSNLDDNFIRVAMASDKFGDQLIKVAYERLGCSSLVFVADSSNAEYTKPYCENLEKKFEDYGGSVIGTVPFDCMKTYSAPKIAKEISALNPDGVVIVANGICTALLCQHINIIDPGIELIPSDWGFTDDALIYNGGDVVNGMIGIGAVDMNSQVERFLRFKHAYKRRFNDEVTVGAVYGYEAMLVLADGLSRTNDPKKLKSAILQQGTFEGVESTIHINRFGDVSRPLYIQQIINGEIVTVETIEAPFDE